MRWSRACLILCSVVAPAWGQSEAPTTGAADSPPVDTTQASGPGVNWVMPPVQWGGSVAYDLRLDHTHGQPRTTEHMVTTSLNALTYLYAPWLALLSGTVGVTASRLGGEPPAVTTHDTFTTGGLRLGVFPRSRFPFEMRYEVSDSRTDSSLGGGVDYRSRQLVLNQRYRPAGGEFAINASYERRAQDGPTFGEDSQEALMADFSSRWKRHNLAASVSRSINRRQQTDEETDFRSVVGRHTYAEGTELTVETGFNWARNDERLLIGDNLQTLTQWSSVALYRPEGQGLTLSASARGFGLQTTQQGTTDTVALGVGAGYEVNRNFRLNANANVTRTDGETAMSWVGSLGGTYQGDSRKFGELNYDWNLGATISNARSQGFEDNTLSTQVGHTMSRVWPTSPGSSWTATLGQTLSTSYTAGDTETPGHPQGLSRALTQTAGLTWLSNGPNGNAFARASFSDARQFDAERARFQLLNLQLSGNYEIDRFRGWSGDLTVQRVFQRSLTFQALPQDSFLFDRVITHTASGEITWRQQRLFGVPRLRFQSRLRLSHDTQYLSSALVSVPDRESASWENRLDYLIGRLEASATLRVAKTDELWRELLLLRLQRSF